MGERLRSHSGSNGMMVLGDDVSRATGDFCVLP